MYVKHTPRTIKKIICGVLAVLFLFFLAQTQEINLLSITDTAHATHVDPFECTDDGSGTDTGAYDAVVCRIQVVLNYAKEFALSLVFTFAWLIVAALWFTVIVIPRLAFWIIYEIVVGVSSLCIMLSTKLIESAVYPGEPLAQGLLYNPNVLNAIHTALWIPVRDIVHVGFALLLIAGAIITIVKANKDVIATYGPKFMVAIVLVNFSWFIPRVVLDLANVSAVASFSLARCDNCYTIENVYLLPFTCTESPPGANQRLVCPTLLLTVEEIRVQNVAKPARKAMGALLDPFMEILNLRVLPRTGYAWQRISKLFMIYNERNTDFDREVPPNPGYPPGWIGVGNIIKCVWMTCENPPDPIVGRINHIGAAPNFFSTVGQFFVGAFLGTFRLIILVFLSAIFLVLYVFALLALMAMVLLRIPIIWLTMGFMPVVALAFVLGRGGVGGFLWGVWDKFVGAAFIPAAIGIPIAAGSAILNVARNIGNPLPSAGIVADLFGPDGIIQIMFIIIAIIVIWLGVFAAISAVNFAGAAQQAIGSRVKTLGQGAAMATGYAIASKAPILPLGKMDRAAGMVFGAALLAPSGIKRGWQAIRGTRPGGPPPGPKPGTGASPKPTGPVGGARTAATKETEEQAKARNAGKPFAGKTTDTGTYGVQAPIPLPGKKTEKPPTPEEQAKARNAGKPFAGKTTDTGTYGLKGEETTPAPGETAALPVAKETAAPTAKTREPIMAEKIEIKKPGAAGAPPGTAGKGIGEEVRKGAREGVIEGMGGKAAEEKEAPPSATEGGEGAPATGEKKPGIAEKLAEYGGKFAQRGAVGHVAATGKEWWNKFQESDRGKRMSAIAGGTRKLLGNLFSGSALQKGLVGFAMKAGTGQLDTVFSDYARGGGDRSLGDILKARLRPQASRDTAGKTADALHQRKEAPILLDAIDKLGTKDEIDALNTIRTLLGNIARDKSLNIDTDRGLPSTVKVLVDTVMDNPSHALHSTFRNRLGGKSGLSLEKDIIEALGRTNPPPATPPTSPAPSPPPATPPPTTT